MKHKKAALIMIPLAVTQIEAFCEEKSVSGNASQRPNILLMIADDCTFTDLGCYGSVNSTTPNIDSLASQGMRFTNFFQATPMSSPTRQCLMTGLYPIRNGAFPNHAKVNLGTTSVVQYMKSLGYRVALQGKRHIAPEKIFDFEYLGGGNEDVNPDKVQAFILDAQASGKPFCLFVCSHQPHVPWDKGDQASIDPEKLVLPSYYVDTKETRTDFRNYIAEVNYLDGQVGDILQVLDETGVADNTVFFFTSEQGNSLPYAKYTCYDKGVQTGMIVRWPGTIKKHSECDALAEYVDVVPTFIDIAGGEVPDSLDGKSFLRLLKGDKGPFKNEVYAAQTTRGIINGPDHYGIRSVRNERYIYIRNLTPEALFRCETISLDKRTWASWIKASKTDTKAEELVWKYQNRPAEELYDRIADPDQRKNLAGKPEYAGILKYLSDKLDAWMESQGDRGQETEMEAFEHQMQSQKSSQKKFLSQYRGRLFLNAPYIFEEDGIYYLFDLNGTDDSPAYRSIDLAHWEGPWGKKRKDMAYRKTNANETLVHVGDLKVEGYLFKDKFDNEYVIFNMPDANPENNALRTFLAPCVHSGKRAVRIKAGNIVEPEIY